MNKKIAIIGCGNIGTAIAEGFIKSKKIDPENVILTRRNIYSLDKFKSKNFKIMDDNIKAVKSSEIIFITVLPQQIDTVLNEIKSHLDSNKHILISTVTNVSIWQIKNKLGFDIYTVRAMPNTAVKKCESMTCLAVKEYCESKFIDVKEIFDFIGKTILIDEKHMIPATALCACGIAFFLRAIRAASQGGIEIGFHSEEALLMAAQTARGAASLLIDSDSHPESEIDKVTSPQGCTISGLNEMEHQGFSSAMIKGIKLSSNKAGCLYNANTN